MRLLVINWQDPRNPRAGGAERHLREIFGRLAARGHKVTVLASGWAGCAPRDGMDGMEIHRVGRRHSFAFRAPIYYRRVLAAREFDVVIEDLNKIPLYVPAWTNRPVVVIAHHLFGGSAFGAASLPIAAATWALEHTLGVAYRGVPVQAVSESTALDLCRHGLCDRDVAVIHNGVAVDDRVPRRYARSVDPTFLYLGRLQAYKRVDLILRAVARLRRRPPAIRLIVAGRGPDEPRLRRLARALDIAEVVEFPGFVTEQTKRELFATAWANVLTSSKEGWGITVLEAAAAGTPTIASASPGLRDAVRDGVTGLLVPHGDVAALADAMARLGSDRDYAELLGRAARALAERSTWERAADQTEAHLRAVARGLAGDAVRARRRDQRAPVPLPHNGRGPVSFGCSVFWVEARSERGTITLRLVLGARDRRGDEPVLLLDHVESSDQQCRSTLRRLEQRLGSVQSLSGWPCDPMAFITALLREVLAAEWALRRTVAPSVAGTPRAVPNYRGPRRARRPTRTRAGPG